MGSLPDSKYIIKTGPDDYYQVYAHDVDPSKGYITVSAKGIANGRSDRPNDDCDFGPDSYNPNYTGSGVPYTQTSGIQEAANYVYSNVGEKIFNNDMLNSALSIPIYLDGDYFEINAPITLKAFGKATAFGPNWHIYGRGIQNTVLDINVNGEWGITIDDNNYYGMFYFHDFSPNQNSPYTPNGWLLADFLSNSDSADTPNIVLSNINIYPGNWSVSSAKITGMIQAALYSVWETSASNGMELTNLSTVWYGGSGIKSAPIKIGINAAGNQNVLFSGIQSLYANFVGSINNTRIENCNDVQITLESAIYPVISVKNVSNTENPMFKGLTGTYTISQFIVDGLFDNTASNSTLVDNSHVSVDNLQTTGIYHQNSQSNFLPPISTTTPSVPTSGTPQSNTNTYPVNVYLYGGTVTVIDYTPSGGSATQVGTVTPMTVRLNPGDSITLTYSAAPTWKWVAD